MLFTMIYDNAKLLFRRVINYHTKFVMYIFLAVVKWISGTVLQIYQVLCNLPKLGVTLGVRGWWEGTGQEENRELPKTCKGTCTCMSIMDYKILTQFSELFVLLTLDSPCL